ncbi:sulfotransferase domain-containing protein [Magnetospirillum sp. 64-120]|uniref:sulfotransferase domain-containing protein n=1 Tax=Magnetospirillum sp. 64-120 TaxID=1895778 RepID=UPI0025BC3289|nr:sulfotransferase domain-containing protein [Magnetospirillum sp. 64-120]
MIDFLGIGAQKAGTTWLFECLRQHPDISFPCGKEMHFWNSPAKMAAQSWTDFFPTSPCKQGEITPAYAILPSSVISQIHACAPRLKLFYSLRNPIERAWSAALMALTRAEMTIDEASDAWFIDHFHSSGSRRRGDYLACLDTWLSIFPQSALQVIVFDDITTRPRHVLENLARHLDVDPAFFQSLPETALPAPAFSGPGHPLRPSLSEILHSLYDPQIVQLENRISRNLAHWRLKDSLPRQW